MSNKGGFRSNPRVLTIVAIVLIAAGILALAYGGFSYKSQEDVVKLGPVDVTAERTKTVAIPPILGGAVLVGGIVLLVVAMRKR